MQTSSFDKSQLSVQIEKLFAKLIAEIDMLLQQLIQLTRLLANGLRDRRRVVNRQLQINQIVERIVV